MLSEVLAVAFKIAFVGIGATLILDLWSLFLRTVWNAPFPNYTMVGRWIGHFPQGRFKHDSVAAAPAVPGERVIGWTAHYGIGILYAALLVAFAGLGWLRAPTLLPALVFGIASVVAPFFIMQPGMGMGVASSRAPKPNIARLRSLAAHTMFGLGLYLAGLIAAPF